MSKKTTEDVNDPTYWAERLREAEGKGQVHRAVFRTTLEKWEAIERRHREILGMLVHAEDWVLDCGCGWGRLRNLLPAGWTGGYLGIDLSPDFINRAIREYGQTSKRTFVCGRLEDLIVTEMPEGRKFDWAVFISIRPMILRHCGEEAWGRMETAARRVSKKLLFLEYDPTDPGEVVTC